MQVRGKRQTRCVQTAEGVGSRSPRTHALCASVRCSDRERSSSSRTAGRIGAFLVEDDRRWTPPVSSSRRLLEGSATCAGGARSSAVAGEMQRQRALRWTNWVSVAPGLVPDVDETRRSRASPRAEENYPPAGDESRIPRREREPGGRGNRVWRFGGVAGADLAGQRGERERKRASPFYLHLDLSSTNSFVQRKRPHDGLPRYVSFEASPSRIPLRERIIAFSGFRAVAWRQQVCHDEFATHVIASEASRCRGLYLVSQRTFITGGGKGERKVGGTGGVR